MRKLAFAVVVCLISAVSVAQKLDPQSILQSAASVKATEFGPVTIIKNERTFAFQADGRLTDTFHSIYRIERADELNGWGTTGTRYEPWHQGKPQITARVISPDGVVHDLDPKTLTDAPAGNEDEDVFSDARRVDAPLPALTKGAIVEEKIVVTDTQPMFAAGSVERVWFSRSVSVESTTVTVIRPQSLPFHYAAYLLPDLKVEKSAANGIETIVFTNGRLEPDDSDLDNAPSGEPAYPQLAIATGASWNSIAAAYAKATEPKIVLADVQSLVTDADRKLPRDERIARLLDRLHKKVRYTGVEFGESSLVPANPAETLKRQFGDCKDKATLLVAMLRAGNVPAKLALLNADSIQAMADLPGMAFDHAIVYVPAGDGGKEYWIDATSTFSSLGSLPYDDYGRAALIVDEQTSSLTTIPQLRSAGNVQTETRLFELAEDGPSRIVETDQDSGPSEAHSRDYASTRTKDTRDAYQKYVRGAYLSEKLGELKFGDPTDMTKPFTVTIEALKAPRGGTDFERAVVAILPFDITDGLPNALRYEQDKEKKAKTRRVDFEFNPSIRVWRYDIHPPMGYKAGTLPPNIERSFGTAKLTQKYEVLTDGRIQATLAFDTGKGRLTPVEAEQMRTALAELRNASAIFVGFDSEPLALINSGKVKDGLALYEKFSFTHPKEALHKIQLASALLDLGLGERARAVAKQALAVEPKFAKGHWVYAQILERDLIGRRFGKGFDYQGAIDEYRKAKALDPDDKDLRTNLAILLEHSPEGQQYEAGCKLEDALKEWAELEKIDEEYARKYQNNVLFDLWHLEKFPELQERIAAAKQNDAARQLLIASIAVKESPAAAIERVRSLASDRSERSKLAAAAGSHLMRRRYYQQAAALFKAAAADSENGAQVLSFAAVLENTKRLEKSAFSAADPVGALMFYTLTLSEGSSTPAQLRALYSARLTDIIPQKQLERYLQSEQMGISSTLAKAKMNSSLLMDIVMSASKSSKEGDDASGYKVTTQSQNTKATRVYFFKENGQWRLVAEPKHPEYMGAIVLDALQKGDTATARRWLDWAREETQSGASFDDPLAGELFARFWTKGQTADDVTLRRAAIALVHETAYTRKIADQMPALFSSPAPADQTKFLLLRAAVARRAQRYAELETLAAELLKQYPDSKVAGNFAVDAALQLKKFDQAEAFLQPFLKREPKDRALLAKLAEVQAFRGDFAAAQKAMAPLMEEGTATPEDLNMYAWYSLFKKDGVDKVSLEVGERGNQISKDHFPIMHTLACQYADLGRGKDAYNLIIRAMDAASFTEPNTEIWYTLGRIAESYGETDAALAMYKRVEPNDEGLYHPVETIILARRHMDPIIAAQKTTPSASAQTGTK